MGSKRTLLVVLLLAAPACTGDADPSAGPARSTVGPSREGWTSFRHPEQPWSWRHPEGWRVQTFDDDIGLATHEGAVLTNVRHRFRHPDLPRGEVTSGWDFAGVPAHAVVVEMSQTIRLANDCARTTETPLDPGVAERARGEHGSPPRHFLPICIRGHSGFGLHVWIGEEASAEDRAAVRGVVRSLRFL